MLVAVLLFAAVFTMPTAQLSSNDLAWNDFDAGLKKSRASGKPMIVDFYADWCSWCKVMDEKTFSNPGIRKILKDKFVLVRIDVEKNQQITYDGRKFSTKEFQAYMRVSGLPTLAFFDKQGKPITLLPGFVEPRQLEHILGYISSECYTRQVTFEQYVAADGKCIK
ncbi:MAG: thioredoxin family protein [Spirochaetota bacterium]